MYRCSAWWNLGLWQCLVLLGWLEGAWNSQYSPPWGLRVWRRLEQWMWAGERMNGYTVR
jgi:hypothetical protein